MRKLAKTLVALAIASSAAGAFADDKADAVAVVDAAVKAVAANKDEGIKGIQYSAFSKGEVYAFAYKADGTLAAHPSKPTQVGQNLLSQPDDNGKMFRKEIVAASAKGIWVDYALKNKAGELQQKTAYCKKAGDLSVCAAIVKH